jgi:poly(hydroxyalkanoate) depolymerase family esterase
LDRIPGAHSSRLHFKEGSSKVHNPRYREMLEASRLTRTGRLVKATARLQQLLGTVPASVPTADSQNIEPAIDPSRPKVSTRSAFDSEGLRIVGAPTPKPFAPEGLRNFLKRVASATGLGEIAKGREASSPDVVPDGGRFIPGSYFSPAGARSYKLYVPSGYRGEPRPLIVMLHGCNQSADDFATGTRMNLGAEEHVCLVAYPEQPTAANASKCWNWFREGDQQREQGEPSLIAGITRQIMGDYAVDSRRVYIAGLSAGGAAAAVMGSAYPDLYAAVGVHSGLACGAANDIASALTAMRQGRAAPRARLASGGRFVPTIVFHGDQDAIVHPRNSDHVIAHWTSTATLKTQVYRGEVAGGHAFSRTVHIDASGHVMLERWDVHGAGHAWSGGHPAGTFTDPRGPDASREMLRFFLEHVAASN